METAQHDRSSNITIIDDYGTYVDPRIDSRQVSSIGRTPSQVSEKTISSS